MTTQQIIKNMTYAVAGIFLSFAMTGCYGKKAETTDSFVTLEAQFSNPPSEFRTAPFMVWNGKVTETEIDRMLKEFKDAGCGGTFIHPRPGMITEYMSDEWYSLYRHAVNKGKEMGMNIWIYDENSYPSGFAGGHVPEEMPESYNQGQGLALTKTELLPDKTDEYFIILKKEGDKWTDISQNPDKYKSNKGEYYLYKKTYLGKSDWYGGYSYVDLLVPGVTDKFLETTMKGYEKTIKNEFGTAVLGIFTDEPNISSPGGLRWTPDLFEVFQKRWGYDLKPLIPLLNEETGNYKQVRHNYMETLLQLFIDRWSKPYHNYCEANNLEWTGHYWEHGWPQMNDGPDNMAMYAWHQVPAIDMLFNQFDETNPQAQFGNIRSVKELRSAANQTGCSRTLSETYGGGGWDETFKDFKRLGDWEYVLGVNFMNQHLAHMTLTGARKYDYPPVFTYHSPWWPNYRELNDYFGRLSLVLSKGIQKNDILILEPNSTLWSYYAHTGSSPKLMEIGTAFQTFITKLEKNQVEYDLGSENIIKDLGKAEKGRFIVGKTSYSTVVLPPMMETLNKPTFDLLRQFVRQGGRIITFSAPTLIDGAESSELSEFLLNTSIIPVPELNKEVIDKYFTNSDFRINTNGGSLYHQRRRFADGELLFLVNASMDETANGTLSIPAKTILEMNAMNGEIYTYPSQKEGNKQNLSFRIEPAGSLLLYCTRGSQKDYPVPPAKIGDTPVASTNQTTVSRLKDNALTIDFCDVTVKGETHKKVHFSQAADIAFKAHGFANGNPWNTSVQYKRNILDRDNFKDGGFKASYHFTINDAFDYSGMKLVSERPELFTVKINGTEVKALPDEWWLDRSFGVYQIGKEIKKGNNTIELSINPMSIFAEIEPVYIIGNFSVVPEKEGWSISAPVETLTLGSWKKQKQPFYSWDMRYSKEYKVDKITGRYAVKLNKWNGTVSEVYVNGKKAGIIAFNPWKLDITPLLKEGSNQIDVHVIGSLKNLLGPHYRNPAPGLASPWHWKNVDKPIPGNDYQMIDYGLMEDFELVH
ncbi:glycosyl hydrolase [Parabacteroides sp. AM08-6]|uniref:glycosyl hydrolase n=1 Tax=Parabacteroides sp. AM08-6 TaxID=2292053 RepID=UPI000F00B197|nr:glycosyl hydrolase [Parabacteroides sp. AM08-6]RHJ84773.1 hypothetical protein DW103_04815 [Parabacteroides sp. AM08-6]